MSKDELDLNELARLVKHLHIIECQSGGYDFYFFDGVNQAHSLTLEEAELIKQALPRLIELARLGQAAAEMALKNFGEKRGRIDLHDNE